MLKYTYSPACGVFMVSYCTDTKERLLHPKIKANPFARLRLILVWMPHSKLNYAKSGGTLQHDGCCCCWIFFSLFACIYMTALALVFFVLLFQWPRAQEHAGTENEWMFCCCFFTCVAPVALESWPCSWGMCFLASWMSFSSLGEGFRLYSSFKA